LQLIVDLVRRLLSRKCQSTLKMSTNQTIVITGVDDYICNVYALYLIEQCKNLNICKEFRVTAENPKSMDELKKKGAKEFQIDYSRPETCLKAFTNADWVVVVPEMRGDREDMKKRMHFLFDCASQARVGGVIMISSVGVDSKYHNLEIFCELEKYLCNKCSGMQCVALRGAMMYRDLLFFSTMVQQNKQLCLPIAPNNRFAPVHLFDIGDATICVFQGKAKEKVYTLTGPVALSGNDIASELSSFVGTNIPFKEMTISDFEKMMKDAPKDAGINWPKLPSYLHAMWLTDHFRLVRDDKLNCTCDDFRKLTHKDGRPISSFFKDHAQAFRPH